MVRTLYQIGQDDVFLQIIAIFRMQTEDVFLQAFLQQCRQHSGAAARKQDAQQAFMCHQQAVEFLIEAFRLSQKAGRVGQAAEDVVDDFLFELFRKFVNVVIVQIKRRLVDLGAFRQFAHCDLFEGTLTAKCQKCIHNAALGALLS